MVSEPLGILPLARRALGKPFDGGEKFTASPCILRLLVGFLGITFVQGRDFLVLLKTLHEEGGTQ